MMMKQTDIHLHITVSMSRLRTFSWNTHPLLVRIVDTATLSHRQSIFVQECRIHHSSRTDPARLLMKIVLAFEMCGCNAVLDQRKVDVRVIAASLNLLPVLFSPSLLSLPCPLNATVAGTLDPIQPTLLPLDRGAC